MKIMQIYLLIFLLLCSTAETKVLIITSNYSNPEFIPIQNETFKKFIQDEYEFVVFSDAPTEAGHIPIATMCAQCNVKCIRVPQSIHEYPYYMPLNMPEIYQNKIKPSNVRHVHSIQYALNLIGFDYKGIVVLVDSDMFLTRQLNVKDFMKDCDIASFFKGSANEQGATIMYCCPVLTFLNMDTLPEKKSISFNCGWVNGCSADSGGYTYYYLKAHPELRLKYIGSILSGDMYCSDRFYPPHKQTNIHAPAAQKISFWLSKGFNEKDMQFLLKNPDTIEYYIEGANCYFFHYRGGTNYEKLSPSYHENKKNLVREYVNNLLN